MRVGAGCLDVGGRWKIICLCCWRGGFCELRADFPFQIERKGKGRRISVGTKPYLRIKCCSVRE